MENTLNRFFDVVRYRYLRSIVARAARYYYNSGEYRQAAMYYAKCLSSLDGLNIRSVYNVKRHWEYEYHRSLYRLGESPHSDPFFDITFSATATEKKLTASVGVFSIRVTHSGFFINGNYKGSRKNIVVCIDDQDVMFLSFRAGGLRKGHFNFFLKRSVVDHLPKISHLSLKDSASEYLVCSGSVCIELQVPHGDGSFHRRLEQGSKISKKGYLTLTDQEVSGHQDRFLDLYVRVRQHFEEHLNKKLFILYGTLLGLIREGDFIKGDDDFDAGYVSFADNPYDVKKETMELVIELVLAGFTCSFNTNGRLFRIRDQSTPGLHLDVRPVWFERDKVWLHKQACLSLIRSDFLPVAEGELRGKLVYTPALPEKFLASYYGSGWKIPDPSYSNGSQRIPKSVTRHLNKVCISPEDYRFMLSQIDRRKSDYPGAGQLISIGLHPLYPLTEYEANCEW